MCDLSTKAVFRAIAFLPTEEELRAATQRKYPGSMRNSSRFSQASSSRQAPPAKSRDFVMELSDSSDDELPDPSAILKNHSSSQKGKRKPKSSSDDVCICLSYLADRLVILIWGTGYYRHHDRRHYRHQSGAGTLQGYLRNLGARRRECRAEREDVGPGWLPQAVGVHRRQDDMLLAVYGPTY